MTLDLYLCKIEPEYIEYLRQHDCNIRTDDTGRRKYIGVLLEVNGHKYYAPLSSPKEKYFKMNDKQLDLHKLNKGKLGVINLNNMIPVPDSAVIRFNIEDEPDIKYKNLLRNQAKIIKSEQAIITHKAKTLYSVVNSEKQLNLNKRCSNFKLLEERCCEYHPKLGRSG